MKLFTDTKHANENTTSPAITNFLNPPQKLSQETQSILKNRKHKLLMIDVDDTFLDLQNYRESDAAIKGSNFLLCIIEFAYKTGMIICITTNRNQDYDKHYGGEGLTAQNGGASTSSIQMYLKLFHQVNIDKDFIIIRNDDIVEAEEKIHDDFQNKNPNINPSTSDERNRLVGGKNYYYKLLLDKINEKLQPYSIVIKPEESIAIDDSKVIIRNANLVGYESVYIPTVIYKKGSKSKFLFDPEKKQEEFQGLHKLARLVGLNNYRDAFLENPAEHRENDDVDLINLLTRYQSIFSDVLQKRELPAIFIHDKLIDHLNWLTTQQDKSLLAMLNEMHSAGLLINAFMTRPTSTGGLLLNKICAYDAVDAFEYLLECGLRINKNTVKNLLDIIIEKSATKIIKPFIAEIQKQNFDMLDKFLTNADNKEPSLLYKAFNKNSLDIIAELKKAMDNKILIALVNDSKSDVGGFILAKIKAKQDDYIKNIVEILIEELSKDVIAIIYDNVIKEKLSKKRTSYKTNNRFSSTLGSFIGVPRKKSDEDIKEPNRKSPPSLSDSFSLPDLKKDTFHAMIGCMIAAFDYLVDWLEKNRASSSATFLANPSANQQFECHYKRILIFSHYLTQVHINSITLSASRSLDIANSFSSLMQILTTYTQDQKSDEARHLGTTLCLVNNQLQEYRVLISAKAKAEQLPQPQSNNNNAISTQKRSAASQPKDTTQDQPSSPPSVTTNPNTFINKPNNEEKDSQTNDFDLLPQPDLN